MLFSLLEQLAVLVVHLVVEVVFLSQVVFSHPLGLNLPVKLGLDQPLALGLPQQSLLLLFEVEKSIEFLDCYPFIIFVNF